MNWILKSILLKILNQIEEGLVLYSEGELDGRQHSTDVGRIDILAQDKKFVVIKLKAGTDTCPLIGQILSYISWVRRNLAGEREVRGIIITENFDDKLKYAVKEIPNIKRYIVKFEFQDEM